MFAVSAAKSVSVMRLRDADKFSFELARFEIVLLKRFCRAPYCARCLSTAARAASAVLIASCALS